MQGSRRNIPGYWNHADDAILCHISNVYIWQIIRVVALLDDLQLLGLLLLDEWHVPRHSGRRNRRGFGRFILLSEFLAIGGLWLIPIPVTLGVSCRYPLLRGNHSILILRHMLRTYINPALIPLRFICMNYWIVLLFPFWVFNYCLLAFGVNICGRHCGRLALLIDWDAAGTLDRLLQEFALFVAEGDVALDF